MWQGNLKKDFLSEFEKEILKGNLKEKIEVNSRWGTMAIVAGGTTRTRAGEPKSVIDRALPLDVE